MFAVYKTELGYRAYVLARDRKTAERVGAIGIHKYKDTDFPLLITTAGCVKPFRKDDTFIGITEKLNREQCFPKNRDMFEYGWISPTGDTYSCRYDEIMECADMLCEELGIVNWNPCKVLQEQNWIKVCCSRCFERTIYSGFNITDRQLNTLEVIFSNKRIPMSWIKWYSEEEKVYEV